MRFLFVDKITQIAGDSIAGQKHFGPDEPLRYRPLAGEAEVAPGALSEAIGQLASWLCIQRNDFTGRPVFLFADQIKIHGPVKAGATVDLHAEIHELNSETLRFSGTAKVDGVLKVEIQNCSGYFMPLGDLEDPEVSKQRFNAMTSGGLKLDGASGDPFAFDSLAGETLTLLPRQSIRTLKVFAANEPFYKDHFPRFPVTPIVMLNEMIGTATARMLQLSGSKRLMPRALSGIKIRSFVKPCEPVEIAIKLVGERQEGAETYVETTAELIKEGKKILRGSYHYVVREVP